MPTTTPQQPSRRLQVLIHAQAWTDTTVLDLLADFLDAHAQVAETFLAYVAGRAADDHPADEEGEEGEGGEEPEPAEPGQSVDDLDDQFRIQRAPSGDLFHFDQVKDHPINHVWTITEGDGGTLWAGPGFHVVSRLGYITTERPWITGEEVFRFDD